LKRFVGWLRKKEGTTKHPNAKIFTSPMKPQGATPGFKKNTGKKEKRHCQPEITKYKEERSGKSRGRV